MKLILCSLQKFFQYILMIIRNHPIGLDEGTLQDFLRNVQPNILMILVSAVPGTHCQWCSAEAAFDHTAESEFPAVLFLVWIRIHVWILMDYGSSFQDRLRLLPHLFWKDQFMMIFHQILVNLSQVTEPAFCDLMLFAVFCILSTSTIRNGWFLKGCIASNGSWITSFLLSCLLSWMEKMSS